MLELLHFGKIYASHRTKGPQCKQQIICGVLDMAV